jgi:hypothetical protein
MDEDDTQHLDGAMAAALMAAVLLVTVVAVTAALVLATGCAVAIHVQAEPAQVRPADMVGPPAGFITLDGASKDAQISISTE